MGGGGLPGHSVASSESEAEPEGDAAGRPQLPTFPAAEGQVPLEGRSRLYTPMAATDGHTLTLPAPLKLGFLGLNLRFSCDEK